MFGQEEYKYLNGQDCNYCKKIHKTGLFFMELVKTEFYEQSFSKSFGSKYEKIL